MIAGPMWDLGCRLNSIKLHIEPVLHCSVIFIGLQHISNDYAFYDTHLPQPKKCKMLINLHTKVELSLQSWKDIYAFCFPLTFSDICAIFHFVVAKPTSYRAWKESGWPRCQVIRFHYWQLKLSITNVSNFYLYRF